LTEFSVLQGVCSSLLRLHTLRLENAAKSAIADFRFYFKQKKILSKPFSVKEITKSPNNTLFGPIDD